MCPCRKIVDKICNLLHKFSDFTCELGVLGILAFIFSRFVIVIFVYGILVISNLFPDKLSLFKSSDSSSTFTLLVTLFSMVGSCLTFFTLFKDIRKKREVLTADCMVRQYTNNGKVYNDILEIELSITNNLSKFVDLEFIDKEAIWKEKDFENIFNSWDNKNDREKCANGVIHPILINNEMPLQFFIFMKDEGGNFHRSITIPPYAENFNITLYVSGRCNCEAKSAKTVTIVTKKDNYFTFKVKKH